MFIDLGKFKFKDTRESIDLYYGRTSLVSFHKVNLEKFVKEILSPKAKAEDIKKTYRLIADYNKIKRRYYKNKTNITNYTTKNTNFKYFKKAVETIEKFDISNSKFLMSQIEGLKFLHNGKGAFPKPSHLAGDGAEDRLLEYLESNDLIYTADLEHTGLDTGKINFSDRDRKTPLSKNTLYVKLLKKLRANEATLDEAIYLKRCRLARKGDIGSEIKDYILKLKS